VYLVYIEGDILEIGSQTLTFAQIES